MTVDSPAQLIPAWDDDGRFRPFDKLTVHRLGLRHPAISVFVIRGNQVLLQQRAAAKYHTPGFWANTCCTHPHWDETAAECAVRRLDEELGISEVAVRHVGQVEYRAVVPGRQEDLIEHEVVQVFVGDAPALLPISPDPNEVQNVLWITLADLRARIRAQPQQFTPWLRIYLAEHSDMIFAGSTLSETVPDHA